MLFRSSRSGSETVQPLNGDVTIQVLHQQVAEISICPTSLCATHCRPVATTPQGERWSSLVALANVEPDKSGPSTGQHISSNEKIPNMPSTFSDCPLNFLDRKRHRHRKIAQPTFHVPLVLSPHLASEQRLQDQSSHSQPTLSRPTESRHRRNGGRSCSQHRPA